MDRTVAQELNRLYAYTLVNFDRDAATFRDMKYVSKTLPKDAIFENQGDYVEIVRMLNKISSDIGLNKTFEMVDKLKRKEFQSSTSVLFPQDMENVPELFQIEMRLESIATRLCVNLEEEREAERE